MADVILLAVVVAFFALMVLLVKACEHIIGPDELTAAPADGRDSEPTATDAGGEA
jgi:hypothetical protein